MLYGTRLIVGAAIVGLTMWHDPSMHAAHVRMTPLGPPHAGDAARSDSIVVLYEKTGDSTFRLVGAMYTAPASASLADLDARVPLSVAQWHLHVDICLPRRADRARWSERDSCGARRFGPEGSITTEGACDTAGGRFLPHVFGWMVHVYPDSTQVWGDMGHM